MTDLLSFYKGKKVLLTGHTGFKGAYLARILQIAGAEVTGYSLMPPTDPSLFVLADVKKDMNSIEGDVRDKDHLLKVMKKAQPEIVFHLAAQPLVRLSYEEPHLTYETNVMGTVNMMEALRLTDSVRSFVNVTTDKVYYNDESQNAFKEDDPLNGYDPYSNSKSCSDIITQSYRSSFFADRDCAISSARAGNVIGGCDFAKDRLIPDCVRAAAEGVDIIIRNPYSVRPFQHVLEPLSAYLLLAKKQYEDRSFEGAYNVGPDKSDCVNAGDMSTIFCKAWEYQTDKPLKWVNLSDDGPHEAAFLMLDNQKIKDVLGWESVWNVHDAIEKTVEMEAARLEGRSVRRMLDKQIREYFNV
ncbi:MAG: CDP-glucose 4,6-dehydratase [Lachnospiraceae bacterium]|nr:CDP-glucose 4,6-dehydratase [Candidatus Equihabitans merdae]